mmetsp:Transcript_42845/g.121403  ORF Transcript_42845/g.121403 Transcript_42845/m.121403 type:complete len:83 (+) Transcript_42845:2846-3094(+)
MVETVCVRRYLFLRHRHRHRRRQKHTETDIPFMTTSESHRMAESDEHDWALFLVSHGCQVIPNGLCHLLVIERSHNRRSRAE